MKIEIVVCVIKTLKFARSVKMIILLWITIVLIVVLNNAQIVKKVNILFVFLYFFSFFFVVTLSNGEIIEKCKLCKRGYVLHEN